MKKVARALKLYIQAAAHPFVIGFGLFIMLGMSLLFILEPDPVGSKDYLTMLGSVQMGNFGLVFAIIAGNAKLQQNKFYSSCNCAKELFTISPVTAVAVLSILYDTLLAISAYANLGNQGLSDTLIFNTISSVQMIIFGGCYGKKGVTFISVIQFIAYMTFLSFPFAVKAKSFANSIIGQTMPTAVIITVCGYIFAIAFTLVLENIWWKKGDKFAVKNKALMAAIEASASK
ncbi:MAG: hypothetical protein IKO47_12975 [Ruminococcus sp.]|nr:hypothetical protein [Ruminococcus sp.]